MPLKDSRTVPPPWQLRGEAHALLVWMPRAMGPKEQFVFAGLEGRAGGPALMMFLRYHASSAGPYDELLWLPFWAVRIGAHYRRSVTRIFVSTALSRDSGRENWGIPKELAEFEVTRCSPRTTSVRVQANGLSIAAFRVESSASSLPFDVSVIPRCLRSLVQSREASAVRIEPSARGRLHWARFTELDFNSRMFPDPTRGHLLGACSLENLELEFPAAVPVV